MKKKIILPALIFTAALLSLALAGCVPSNGVPQTNENEITLGIWLDINEDIGLLIIDHDLDGESGAGGISNADKSLLKRGDILYWTFDKGLYENPADTAKLSVRFSVVTEYCDPNYENIYPEEYTIPMNAISFTAEFGKTYFITITGDKANGYQAVLRDP